jgi:hypothetical protein
MTDTLRRFGILVVACAFGLMVAGQAVAAYTPKFSAGATEAGATLNYSQAATDDAPAAITFWVPTGFTALLSFPEGEVIGTASGEAVAADLAGTRLTLKGNITNALATTTISFAGSTVALSSLATLCTGTATHTAYWVVNFTASGQALQVPAYVDDIPITSPLADIANTTIKICLPPPDVPAGTPGRASLGAKVTSATLSPDTFSAPPAWYRWLMTATPYSPGTGKANPAGSVELQSLDRTPQELSLKATKVKGKAKTVLVTGKVSSGGKGVAGADVKVMIGTKVVGSTKSRAGGAYAVRVVLPRASATLRATATAPVRAGGTCTATFPPIPCAGATTAGFSVKSAAVRVKT